MCVLHNPLNKRAPSPARPVLYSETARSAARPESCLYAGLESMLARLDATLVLAGVPRYALPTIAADLFPEVQ